MKNLCAFILSCFIFNVAFAGNSINEEFSDSTGLPGDQFSLQGALEMFKLSTSLEDFELRLNTSDNSVNNLDLNGDGEVDYIRVVDHMEKDAHAIVLQVPVNDQENQDVAVIELEKNGNESAEIQVVGDEEIYGDLKIAEPFDEVGEKNGKGPAAYAITPGIVNVWMWPSVKFLYAPGYVVYVSPWKYKVYPKWWKPWKPLAWRHHYRKGLVYRNNHHFVNHHRVVVAHRVYVPHRKTSVVVVNRHKVARDNHKMNQKRVNKNAGPRNPGGKKPNNSPGPRKKRAK